MKTGILKLVLCSCLLAFNVQAQTEPSEGESESGQALPRMVSLRSDIINGRSGPGTRYPISWIYRQRQAPVEVVAEFDLWRKIKDWKGAESWIHKNMLSSKRTAKFITPGENNIYAAPDFNSKVIARAEEEVVAEIQKCPSGKSFCKLKFKDGIEGWAPRNNLFGVYNNEVID